MREALSLLTESDDFRVRALTDAEPASRPLGPFAVVDIVAGAEDALASQRQTSGYYELVQSLVEERLKKAPLPSSPPRRAPALEAAAWSESAGQPPVPTQATKPAKTRAASVAEKIAPKKRAAGEERPEAPMPEQALSGSAFLPKRTLPAPRGRFTRVEAARAPFDDLLGPAMKSQLDALIDQTSTRIQLRQALELGYSGKRGGVLSVADVEEVIEHHHLLPRLEKKEKEVLLGTLRESKGATGRASTTLGMTPQEFSHLSDQLSLRREVDEIRSHWVREALSPKNLSLRFDLLGRSRYLQDLNIEAKFQTALARDLDKLLKEANIEGDFAQTVRTVARNNALNHELLGKTVERLGLWREDENHNDENDGAESPDDGA